MTKYWGNFSLGSFPEFQKQKTEKREKEDSDSDFGGYLGFGCIMKISCLVTLETLDFGGVLSLLLL